MITTLTLIKGNNKALNDTHKHIYIHKKISCIKVTVIMSHLIRQTVLIYERPLHYSTNELVGKTLMFLLSLFSSIVYTVYLLRKDS